MIVLTYRNWYVFLYINSTSKIRQCQLKSINYLNGSSVQEISVFLLLFYINGNCLRLIFVFVKTSRVKLIIGRITIKKRAWTVGMIMLELFLRQVIVLRQVIQALFRSRYFFKTKHSDKTPYFNIFIFLHECIIFSGASVAQFFLYICMSPWTY